MIRPEPEIIFTFVQTKRSMKVLYTALLALLLFPSCRRQSGDIDSFLHNAESLMNEHPEDALSIIRHIDRRKIYSSASEARYALLYSQALDKNYVDVTSDSLTAVAVNYYDRHGTKHERAWPTTIRAGSSPTPGISMPPSVPTPLPRMPLPAPMTTICWD